MTALSSFGAMADIQQQELIGRGYAQDSKAFDNVAFLRLYQGNGISTCTGTIIGARYVLMAAHCVSENFQMSVTSMLAQTGYAKYKSLKNAGKMNPNYTIGNQGDKARYDVGLYKLARQAHTANAYMLSVNHRKDGTAYALGYAGDQYFLKQGIFKMLLDKHYPLIAQVSRGGNFLQVGDSGGPWLKYVNGKVRQIGVTSLTVTQTNDYTGEKKEFNVGSNLRHSSNQNLIIDTVNSWHYAGLQFTKNGSATFEIQSLHKNTATFALRDNPHYAYSGTCVQQQSYQPFEICELTITSHTGRDVPAVLQLGNGQTIKVNKGKKRPKPVLIAKPGDRGRQPIVSNPPDPSSCTSDSNSADITPAPEIIHVIEVHKKNGGAGGSGLLLLGALGALVLNRKRLKK